LVEELLEREGAGITDLADDLDMSKSTVHNHLNTLRDCGYVVKDGTEYRVGLKFLHVGGLARSHEELYPSAKPEVERLAAETGAIVVLATEEHGEGVVLTQLGQQPSTDQWYAGKRFGLLDSPVGEAILAALPERRTRAIVDADADRSPETVWEQLDEYRDQGYVTSTASQSGEIRRVAAPIRDPENDAFGSVCLIEHRDADMTHSEEETIEMVTTAAEQIIQNLEQSWFGSQNVVTAKHSLSAYTGRTVFGNDNDDS
jgi:DNA-binding IclR family transcriptional regulator